MADRMPFADPLSVLREFHLNKKDIVIHNDRGNELVVFGDVAFNKSAKTNYLVYGHDVDSEQKEYYTLDCLVYFLKHVDLQHPNYVRKATGEKLAVVRRPDRKDLLAYMNGEINTTDRIDKYAPIEPYFPFKGVAEKVNKHPQQQSRADTEKGKRDREKLVARLEAPKDQTSTVSTDKLISLSDAIPSEKLAAIKAKILAKKRTQIRPDDDPTGASELQPVGDTESDGLQDILSRERVSRNRNDVTKGSRDLTARLGPVFAMIKAKEEGKLKNDNKNASAKTSSVPVAKPAALPAVYSRYDQEQFNKADVTDFGINTMSSYRGAPNPKAVLDGSGTKSATDRSAVQQETAEAQRKKPSKTPIIIIPSAPTSLITMYNCADLLQDNRYVPSDTKKKEGTKYETEMLIQRKKADGSVMPIRVLDNPVKLNGEDWDRVVAVFVQGQAWQFKGWPWSGNPVDIFDKIKAYHIKFEEMPTDKNVAAWNVHVIPISRMKRHLDRASLLKFWESLDKFVVKNKPQLRW